MRGRQFVYMRVEEECREGIAIVASSHAISHLLVENESPSLAD
jgi:hypothetical protein